MKKLLSILLMAFAAVSVMYGQSGLSTLAGTVTDQSGAVIANATVKLTGPNGVDRTAATNQAGYYHFTAVPVAEGYTLLVSAPGFASTHIAKVDTSVGTT